MIYNFEEVKNESLFDGNPLNILMYLEELDDDELNEINEINENEEEEEKSIVA